MPPVLLKKKVDATVVVVVADGDPHRIAEDVRRRVRSILELQATQVPPGLHLPGVVRDDQIELAVFVDVDEDALKGVVRVAHARSVGDVREGIVPVVEQQEAVCAVVLLVEDVQPLHLRFRQIGGDEHVDRAIAVEIGEGEGQGSRLLVEGNLELRAREAPARVEVERHSGIARDEEIVVAVAVDVDGGRAVARIR